MSDTIHSLETVFVTRLYRAELLDKPGLNEELLATCLAAAADDEAGQDWSEENGYPGYTSYASLNDLGWRFPAVKTLIKQLDKHAKSFAKLLEWDLGERKLVLDSLWINVLEPGGFHSGHIHPGSVISGTYYVSVPDGAGAITFEDPRLPRMMAAPPKKKKAARDQQAFVSVAPTPGSLLLWESWMHHAVPLNRADAERISISFNYAWR
ncbi:TIGR02466 family protein [Elstera sp.]|jgi:uncharacterized protein (TIGR02466 family)|uniref:TIGR02466 family protein n=1 Tax=Elstera sp. TaxID=1916664 RepID=UPI0037C0947B